MELGTNRAGGDEKKPIWMELDYAKEIPYNTLQQYTLTPQSPTTESQAATWSFSKRQLSPVQLDLPSVNPKRAAQKVSSNMLWKDDVLQYAAQ